MRLQQGFTPHVTTLGQGPRPALALHCTLAFGGAWGGVARALGDVMTFVAPDMPSHGKSVDWDGISDFGDTYFEAASGLLDPDQPMDVIGHSFGAATALRIAVEHPAKLRSLSLFEPVFFAVALADDPDALNAHDARAQPVFDLIKTGDFEAAARAFNRMWSDGAKWDDLPERTRAAMTRAIHVVPDNNGFLYKDTCGLLAPGGLNSVEVPTLLMRGEHALPAVVATNDGLARRMGADQCVISGAGHMAPITHPVAVADAIRDHLGLTEV